MIDTAIEFIKVNWSNILAVGAALGIGVEIAPVELHPVSWLLKKIGAIMNSDILKKVNDIESDLKDFKREEDMEKINNIRKEIVDFSLSCQRHEHHTRDEFDRVFSRVDQYHDLLKLYKLENGKIDTEVGYIQHIYRECLEENRFFMG